MFKPLSLPELGGLNTMIFGAREPHLRPAKTGYTHNLWAKAVHVQIESTTHQFQPNITLKQRPESTT
uniref:Uncharacterized protein n=1 Tax=Rhizophora mucronata TaxID=61149 RepID=A0A2P2KRW3_RHIMU